MLTDQIHASAVAVAGRGCLITGRPGSGKSRLAIKMIALGARLVADDRVVIRRIDDAAVLSAPPRIAGVVEARGVGLIRLPETVEVPAALIVNLDRRAESRLPSVPTNDLLGIGCPVIFGRDVEELPAILMLALAGDVLDPDSAMEP